MRARLIANPAAGANRVPQLLPLITLKLREIVDDLDITLTTDADDAVRAAARTAADGCDAVYVAGGDGTLNAVLRGLMTADGSIAPVPIGVIPLGTGNDFSKALELGEQPEAALDLLLDQRIAAVDVGLLSGRPFVNTSAGGFIADVSEAVTERLKDATGKLAYAIGAVRTLLGSEPFTATLAIRGADGRMTDAWTGQRDLQLFAVCNARFIGGGYRIAPDARIDDGMLDVLVVPQRPLLEFIAILQKIASGSHDAAAGVAVFRASAFDLTFSRPVRVNTDGEVLEADRCEYRVLPGAARFFCGPPR